MNHNRKRLLLLSFVLILFLALFYSKDLIQKNMTPKTISLFSLNNENTSQFLLTGESLTQKLIKNGSKWFVEKEGKQFAADPEKVSNLIQALTGLTEGTIVSKNKNKHADFGIGTEIIVVKTADRERTLYLGKSYGSSARYARMDKGDTVFVGENLQSILINSDFRDLKTHALDDDSSLQSMEIEMNGLKTKLIKNKDGWTLRDKKLKSETVGYYINDLKNLTATDIIEANTKVTDANPTLTIRLKTQKQESAIDFVKYDDKSYAMKSPSYPWLFLIPEVNVASLQKQEKDFLE